MVKLAVAMSLGFNFVRPDKVFRQTDHPPGRVVGDHADDWDSQPFHRVHFHRVVTETPVTRIPQYRLPVCCPGADGRSGSYPDGSVGTGPVDLARV